MSRSEKLQWRGFIPMSFYPSWLHSEQFCRSRMKLEWLNEGEMRGYFWSKAKPLILNYLPFHNHSVTPWQYPVVRIIIPFIWRPFLSFNHIHANYAKYVLWNWSRICEWLRNEPEWGLNELIRCGLYRRDHTWFIHSEAISPHTRFIHFETIHDHSDVIPW